jgi:hypothetical protein
MIWKIKVLSGHSLGRIQDSRSPGQDVNPGPPENESGMFRENKGVIYFVCKFTVKSALKLSCVVFFTVCD